MSSFPACCAPSSAAVCPLCGDGNQCALASTPADGRDCWCVAATFGAALIARVPEHRRRVACICAACTTAA